jgi:hypothetical protein
VILKQQAVVVVMVNVRTANAKWGNGTLFLLITFTISGSEFDNFFLIYHSFDPL